MNDARARAMDMAFGGGAGAGGPAPEEAAPEAPESASEMVCPSCGARFELKPEEAPEAAGEVPAGGGEMVGGV